MAAKVPQSVEEEEVAPAGRALANLPLAEKGRLGLDKERMAAPSVRTYQDIYDAVSRIAARLKKGRG